MKKKLESILKKRRLNKIALEGPLHNKHNLEQIEIAELDPNQSLKGPFEKKVYLKVSTKKGKSIENEKFLTKEKKKEIKNEFRNDKRKLVP